MSRVTVRRATMADIPWLVGELRTFAAWYGTRVSLFPDEAAATLRLAELIAAVPDCEPGHHPFFLAEKAGEPCGFIAGLLSPHFLNPDLVMLTEMFWWVPEVHRRSMAGGLLFREFEAFGRAYADWIVFTLEHQSPIASGTLLKRGYRALETSYLLEVA